MTLIKKTYNKSYLLYLCLFINSLIYTIILSLIFWHSLVLIKVLIMKCIILFLHKYRVFHGIFYVLLWIYLIYQNSSIGSGEKGLNPSSEDPDKKEKQGSTTTEYVIVGVFVGVIFVLTGCKVLDHYYPEALPAIQSAAVAAGLVLIEKIKEMYESVSQVSVSGHEAGGFKKSSLNWEAAKENAPNPAAFIAVSRAENAFNLLMRMEMKPEDYHYTLRLLRANNVPSKYFCNSHDLYVHIQKISGVGAKDSFPIYTFSLSNIDLMFYDTMLSINPSKLKQ